MPRTNPTAGAYAATSELEEQLLKRRTVTISGGPYTAVVTRVASFYEAWTEHPPFAYGRMSSSLQGALDALDEAVRRLQQAEPPTRKAS